jgi:RimJ/RimL family protein N-acetyltransferase
VVGDEAIVDVSLAPEARGTGAAPGLLRAATRRLFEESDTSQATARIKAANRASLATFQAADYEPEPASRSPEGVVELVYRRGRDGRG